MDIIRDGWQYPWFALHTRSKFERLSATALGQRGYENLLPTYRSRRCWSDRIKESERPLFPGYVFCRLDPMNRLKVLQIPGVVRIVGIGNEPTAISNQEIEAIRIAVNSGVNLEPWPFLNIGDRVVVCHGPLTGIEGILKQQKGGSRIVLSVTLMQRSVAAEIDRIWVRPCEDPSRRQTRSPGERAASRGSNYGSIEKTESSGLLSGF